MPVNERRNRSLLERLRVEPRRLVDQLLPGLPHVLPAEHGLDLVAVYPIANPNPDAAIPEGLAAAVDLAGVEGGDMVVRLAVFSPTGRPAPSRDPFRKA